MLNQLSLLTHYKKKNNDIGIESNIQNSIILIILNQLNLINNN